MSYWKKDVCIYLAHPRTASIATEHALQKVIKGGLWSKPHHLGIDAFPERTGNECVFTTTRNPLDVIVSWWLAWKEKQPRWNNNFLLFIKRFKHPYLEQNGRMFFFNREAHVTLRFERLQEDFNLLCDKLGIQRCTIGQHNTTADKKPFMSYHNSKSIAAMWDRFEADMTIYHKEEK